MCEEHESYHDGTVKPVVGGQSSSSFVPSMIKTNVPLNNDDHAHIDFLLQRYRERIEKLSQQDRLNKFCMNAGFLNVVEIGQYFMTKDTAEFSQFTDAVACRECTLPRDEETSEPKGSIRANTKIGPLLEVTTCCLQGKCGVEIRIMSMNKDNCHSWIRISHGSNKLVTNLNNNEQETSEVQFEEYALRLNAGDFASRSKAKAKPQRRDSAGSSTRTTPLGKELGPMLNQENIQSPILQCRRNLFIFDMQEYKEKTMERLNSGESKTIFRNISCIVIIVLTKKWKKSIARGGGNKKIFQYCADLPGAILYLRALQGHSGRSLIDPTLTLPSLLYPESCSDGNWRSQNFCVSSSFSKDFLET